MREHLAIWLIGKLLFVITFHFDFGTHFSAYDNLLNFHFLALFFLERRHSLDCFLGLIPYPVYWSSSGS